MLSARLLDPTNRVCGLKPIKMSQNASHAWPRTFFGQTNTLFWWGWVASLAQAKMWKGSLVKRVTREGRQLCRDFVTDCPLWPNWASAVLGMGMPLPPGRLLHTLHVTDSLISLFIKDVFLQPILDFGSLLAWIKELDGCAFWPFSRPFSGQGWVLGGGGGPIHHRCCPRWVLGLAGGLPTVHRVETTGSLLACTSTHWNYHPNSQIYILSNRSRSWFSWRQVLNSKSNSPPILPRDMYSEVYVKSRYMLLAGSDSSHLPKHKLFC